MLRDGEARSQAGALNAEEIDETGNPVIARSLDPEIGRGFAGT